MTPEPTSQPARPIGVLGERSLHAALKRVLWKPGDAIEVKVDGYFIDLVRGDQLIEIQTTRFSGVRGKYRDLAQRHTLLVVHTIAAQKTIVRLDRDGVIEGKRRSPSRKRIEHVFDALAACPELINSPNFSVLALLVIEEEVRQRIEPTRRRRWTRTWKPVDHRLVDIVAERHLRTANDLAKLLPRGLPASFTSGDVAERSGLSTDLAQKMTYVLRHCGAIEAVGKRGRSVLYRRRPMGGL